MTFVRTLPRTPSAAALTRFSNVSGVRKTTIKQRTIVLGFAHLCEAVESVPKYREFTKQQIVTRLIFAASERQNQADVVALAGLSFSGQVSPKWKACSTLTYSQNLCRAGRLFAKRCGSPGKR